MSLVSVPERELDQLQLRARSPVIGVFYFFLVLLTNLNIPDLQSLAFKQPSPGRGSCFLTIWDADLGWLTQHFWKVSLLLSLSA